MKSPLKYRNSNKSLIGLVILGILIILGYLLFENIQLKNQLSEQIYHENNPTNLTNDPNNQNASNKIIPSFNPNEYTINGWVSLGFSKKQALSILKYKNYLGGKFTSKSQLKECYVISDEKFLEIKDALLLPNYAKTENQKNINYTNTNYTNNYPNPNKRKKLNISGKFNPNDLNLNDWVKIGFSKKQAITILNYKNNYLSGKFTNLEEIKKCYVIDEETFNQLKNYITLTSAEIKTKENLNTISPTKQKIRKEKNVTHIENFNPNNLTIEGWQKLGFTEKQSLSILKYKNNYLKGRFSNLGELKKAYVITEEKFNELKPYIILNKGNKNESTIKNTSPKIKKTQFKNINLNAITYNQLIEFGFEDKAARSFIGFRNILGGFANKEQVLDTYYIDKNLTQKLLDIAILNTSTVKKYHLNNAPENWLKKHPYFKKSADKIIYYRTSFPDDNKIWKFIKVPQKYRVKMEWYLLN